MFHLVEEMIEQNVIQDYKNKGVDPVIFTSGLQYCHDCNHYKYFKITNYNSSDSKDDIEGCNSRLDKERFR